MFNVFTMCGQIIYNAFKWKIWIFFKIPCNYLKPINCRKKYFTNNKYKISAEISNNLKVSNHCSPQPLCQVPQFRWGHQEMGLLGLSRSSFQPFFSCAKSEKRALGTQPTWFRSLSPPPTSFKTWVKLFYFSILSSEMESYNSYLEVFLRTKGNHHSFTSQAYKLLESI